MKKILFYMAFYIIGTVWMCVSWMAFGCLIAPQVLEAVNIPAVEWYIRSAAFGVMSLVLGLALCVMEGKDETSIFRR